MQAFANAGLELRDASDASRSPSRDQSEVEVSDGGQRYQRSSKAKAAPKKASRSSDGQQRPKLNIAMRLFCAMQENRRTQKDARMEFVPVGMLESILIKRRVQREVERLRPIKCTQEEIVEKVCDDDPEPYLKIFAILAIIKRLDAIEDFVHEKISDLDLPLRRRPRKRVQSLYRLRSARNRGKSGRLKCLQEWTPWDLDMLFRKQWCVIAVFFSRDPDKGKTGVPHMSLKDEQILPFLPDPVTDDYEGIEGGFGTVWRVYIHPDHHKFQIEEGNKTAFAVKSLRSADEAEFRREVEVLKKISSGNDPHPHLINLLLTYEQFGQYHMLFHWAEADLETYWEQRSAAPTLDSDTVLWWAKQIHGLADGLKHIHEWNPRRSNLTTILKQYGRHGDIKPKNILWFRHPEGTGGTLKIADFGLSEFRTRRSRSNIHRSEVGGHTLEYCPNDVLISRSYDIWMLGRVYLQLVIWMIGGYKLLSEFRGMEFQLAAENADPAGRNASYLPKDAVSAPGNPNPVFAVVKPATTLFIERLHADPKCTQYLHDLLNIVEKDMLIYETSPQSSSSVRRIPCKDLQVRLCRMLQKCRESPDYGSTGVPRREQCYGKYVGWIFSIYHCLSSLWKVYRAS